MNYRLTPEYYERFGKEELKGLQQEASPNKEFKGHLEDAGSPARTEKTRDKLLELETQRRALKDWKGEHSIRLEQAKLLSDAGFGSRKEFDEFLKKAMPTENDIAEENSRKFMQSQERSKAFDDIRKSEAEKFKDFFSEMDKRIYED